MTDYARFSYKLCTEIQYPLSMYFRKYSEREEEDRPRWLTAMYIKSLTKFVVFEDSRPDNPTNATPLLYKYIKNQNSSFKNPDPLFGPNQETLFRPMTPPFITPSLV